MAFLLSSLAKAVLPSAHVHPRCSAVAETRSTQVGANGAAMTSWLAAMTSWLAAMNSWLAAMICGLIFGFEGCVLHAFVTVQAFVLWSISRISTGAMTVPGSRRVLYRFLPPHLAADAGSAPPRPASVGVVPAPPDITDHHPGLMWRLVESASKWIPPCAVGVRAIVVLSGARKLIPVLVNFGLWWIFYAPDVNCSKPPSVPPDIPVEGAHLSRPAAHRNARGARGCLAEAILSAIVFAYAVKAMAACSTVSEIYRLFLVVVSTLCGAKLGLYHLVNPPYYQRAVDNIVERSDGRERVRPDGTFSLSRHSVDLFEYADMAAFGRIYAAALMVIVCHVPAAVGVLAGELYGLVEVIGSFFRGFIVARLFVNRGVLEQPNVGDVCGVRPRQRVVRCLLLLSCLAYAGLLYFSPGPFVWRGALIVTHVTRSLNLLVSLRGRH